MKNFAYILLLITLFAARASMLPLYGQETMRLNMKNGTVLEFAIAEITKLTFNNSTGLEQFSEVVGQLLKMKAFPNPALDHVNIEYTLASYGDVGVEIFNMNGLRIDARDIGCQVAGKYQLQLYLPDIPAGVYICRIRQNKENVSEKLIIKK
jgi:hypothetical protein